MTLKIITDSFKEIFNDFLIADGYKWYKNFFAKYENGIFVRIYSVCKKYNDNYMLDVLVMPVPTICNVTVEGNEYGKTVISVEKLLCVSNGKTNNFVCKNNFSLKLRESYTFFTENYGKYFKYESLDDFALKINSYYKFLFYDPMFGEHGLAINSDIKLNCLDLAYVFYRTYKFGKCQKSIMSLIALQREMLYNKIQYMYTIRDKKALQNEKKKYMKIMDNYTQLKDFAEALLEENINYLKTVDVNLNNNEIKSIEYIKRLTA